MTSEVSCGRPGLATEGKISLEEAAFPPVSAPPPPPLPLFSPFSNAGTAQAVYIDKTAIFSEDGLHTPKLPYPASLREIPFPFSDCLLGSTPPVLPFLVFHTTEAALGMLQTEISAASSRPLHPAIGLMASRWHKRLAPSAVYLALQGWEWDLMALHTRCCQTHVNDCIRVAGLRKLTLWCLFLSTQWPKFKQGNKSVTNHA